MALSLLDKSGCDYLLKDIDPPPLSADDVSRSCGLPLQYIVKTIAFTFKNGKHFFVCSCGDEKTDLNDICRFYNSNTNEIKLLNKTLLKDIYDFEPGNVNPFSVRGKTQIFFMKKLAQLKDLNVSIGTGRTGKGVTLNINDLIQIINPIIL